MKRSEVKEPSESAAAPVAVFVAFLIVLPALGVAVTGGVVTTAEGTEQFYQAAIGVLSAFLIAFVFQFKPFMGDLDTVLGRAELLYISFILLSWLGAFIAGVAFSLVALQACKEHVCGDADDFNNVVIALSVAGLYMVVAFVTAAIAAHRRPA